MRTCPFNQVDYICYPSFRVATRPKPLIRVFGVFADVRGGALPQTLILFRGMPL